MDGKGKQVVSAILLLCASLWSTSAQPSPQCPSTCNCVNYASAKEIRCDSRALTSIPPNLPTDTQVLRLEFNSIQSIGASDFEHLVDLRRLTFYNNRISFIDPAAFRSQTKLEVLSLQSNLISSIDVRTFWGMGKLTELNLDNNFLTTIWNGTFKDLVKLTDLTMPGNPLQTLPDDIFRSLSNLQTLDVSNVNFDSLSALTFDGLISLRTLKLNNITTNGDALFSSESLFTGVASLTLLEVQRNSLTCIPTSFTALTHLEALYLSRNSLSCEGLGGLGHVGNLLELHLEYTEVTILKAGMFAGNRNMTYLDLAESRLSTIEVGAFEGLGRLQELHLFLNNLTTLPPDVFAPIPNNVEIDLSLNPWNCDCNLRWLREWLVDTHTGVVQYQPTCASPDNLRDRELSALTATDYACTPESVADVTDHVVSQGDTFVVECGIVGDPAPALHWLTPDHEELHPGTIKGPFSVDNACTLTIIRVQESDAGSYSCIGANVAGTVSVRHTVRVELTGIGRPTSVSKTTSHPVHTTSLPLTGKNSSLSVVIAGIVIGMVLIVLLVVICVVCRRTSRKNRTNERDRSLVFGNEPITIGNCAAGPCSEGAVQGLQFPASDDRYADTLPRIPDGQEGFDPPPPYSTLPRGPGEGDTYEEIYDQILEEENEYERPRQPGDMSPAPSVHLQHTYMSQLQRQESKTSQNSCGAPYNYERSLLREHFRRENQYSIGNGSMPRGVAPDQVQTEKEGASDKSGNNLPPKQEKVSLKDDGDGVVNLDPNAKVTYQNTRRP